jgi:hypothetical protein
MAILQARALAVATVKIESALPRKVHLRNEHKTHLILAQIYFVS